MTSNAALSGDPGPKPAAASRAVVVVDLDDTLIKGDTLHEQAIRLLFRRPGLIPGLLRALAGGRASLKAYCASHIVLDADALQACDEVLSYLREQAGKGAYIVLCTAADIRTAQGIADHLGIFDEVIATEGGVNLKGAEKARRLKQRFPQGFTYAGDHVADLEVWAEASTVVLVNASEEVTRRAHGLGKPIVGEFRKRSERPHPITVWRRVLRVHHWSKNILMFVPLVLAHRWDDLQLISTTAMGFILLLAVTSASYIINDLADLDADRRHVTKRMRPIASGQISLLHAAIVPAIVLPVALLSAFLLSTAFAATLAAYLVVTLAYSFVLKRVPLLDTFVIACLFTIRLLMGTAIMGGVQPVWLVTFSMFFFFSLATAKRHSELVKAGRGADVSIAARGYQVGDWPLTLTFGIGAGLASLIILVLYLVDEAFEVVGYARPEFLWFVTLVVAIWMGRVWLLTHRGNMNDDPVSFALRDRASQGLALVALLCFLVAV